MNSTSENMPSSTADFPVVNHTEPMENDHSLYSYDERIFVAAVLSLICIIGIFGNSATIAAVVLSKKLRTDTNVFVVCLAVSDLLTCFGIPLTVFTLLNKSGWPWPEYEWICSASATLLYGFTGSSEICLAAIAINRALLIKYPRTIYRKVYRKVPIIGMCIFLLLGPSVILVFFPLVGIGRLGYDAKHHVCGDDDLHPYAREYELIQDCILYPISFVTIVTCYSIIFLHVRRHYGRQRKTELRRLDHLRDNTSVSSHEAVNSNGFGTPPATPPPTPKSSRLKKIDETEFEINKNLFLAFCVFFLCVTPYALLLPIPPSQRRGKASLYCAVLVVVASCVNPIVYAVRHPQFRSVFGPMSRCRYRDIPEPANFVRSCLSQV